MMLPMKSTVAALLLLIAATTSGQRLTHMCTYNSLTDTMTMSLTARAGTRSIYQFSVIDSKIKPVPSCRATPPTLPTGEWKLSVDILMTTGISAPNCKPGLIFNSTSGKYELSVYLQHSQTFLLPIDKYIILKCNKDTSLKTVITTAGLTLTPPMPIILENVDAQLTFYVVEAMHNNPVTTAAIGQKIRLVAGMRIQHPKDSSPVAMRLSDCTVGPTQYFPYPESRQIIDLKGCPTSTDVFKMTAGFASYETHPLYRVSKSGSPINFLAVSTLTIVSKYSLTNTVFFRCHIHLCFSEFDTSCFTTDQCLNNNGRNKREETRQNLTLVNTAIIVTTIPMSDRLTEETCATSVADENCFPSWIFVLVVVVLILLLVFSVLISFCILYRLNQKAYPYNEKT